MNRKLRLLVVEDEAAISSGLRDVFVYHGYDVCCVADGGRGLEEALTGTYDLVLLDVMLPTLDGYTILERIRATDREQPVIMLTAKSGDDETIHGLALGADDYVAKPFSVAQLVLRVQAVLRRSRVGAEQDRTLRLGDAVAIDTANLSGTRGDEELTFTRREMAILEYLAAHGDRPVPRDELLNKVWGYARDADIETRTVDIHVAKLRRKIEPEPSEPRFLVTVRGAGYRLLTETE
ncbi:MAG: response regulator [Gammaproteobacteria bacterium]|jgi:two-component system response regulator RegX3|nr:response regulator [Gammaproteobacteria bacterium]